MPWLGALSRYWSPYDLNPLNINPLKDLIERFVDFERLRGDTRRELFISATNVHTGERRVFSRAEITAEVVMASACLPLLFQAVEIDGVPYWDGGYSGNPAMLPFLRATSTEDVLIVQINPRERGGAPTSAREIMTRLHEITFNAPLLAELRALELAERLITEGGLPRGTAPGQYRRIRLHRIVMDAGTPSTTAASSTTTTSSSTACASSARPRRSASSTRISAISAARSTHRSAEVGGGRRNGSTAAPASRRLE